MNPRVKLAAMAVLLTMVGGFASATSLLGDNMKTDFVETIADSEDIAAAIGSALGPWGTLAVKVMFILAVIGLIGVAISFATGLLNPGKLWAMIHRKGG